MKLSRISLLLLLLFLLIPSMVSAQKKKPTKKANQNVTITQSGKCIATVRNDLIPKKSVVVVGCDYFGDGNGGIVVLNDELQIIYKWDACSACGGFFSRFAGTTKVKGHKALLIQLVNGPRLDAGGRVEPIVPLYFDGKEFKFAEIPN